VNLQDPIQRVVGRRRTPQHPLTIESHRRADAIAWSKAFGGIRVARGVYRFRTHEEADEWLLKAIARPPAT
jgi:hypothetical protein